MLNWLASIGESIGVFVQFVISSITGVLSVFALIGHSMAFLVVAYMQLPSVLHVFVVLTLSIVIVFQFIGR